MPRASRAFTLIELLTVITIIAVLAGITFGAVGAVKRRTMAKKARAELAVISQALEEYKAKYGDYPQAGRENYALLYDEAGGRQLPLSTSANVKLLNALTGHYGPQMTEINGKRFLGLSGFTLESEQVNDQPDGSSGPVANALLDPWGNRYVYYYKSVGDTAWIAPSYVLYSVGPDGENAHLESSCHETPTSAGDINLDAPANLDNIYANR